MQTAPREVERAPAGSPAARTAMTGGADATQPGDGLAGWIGRRALEPFSRALPPMGDTERAALEAGTVGLEGRLFSGQPDFDALLALAPNRLTDAERTSSDGSAAVRAARRLGDRARRRPAARGLGLPQATQRFFGMIIPKEYGGLGFSALAHCAVCTKLATRSAPRPSR